MKQKNPLIFLVHDIHDRKLRRISSPNQRKYNTVPCMFVVQKLSEHSDFYTRAYLIKSKSGKLSYGCIYIGFYIKSHAQISREKNDFASEISRELHPCQIYYKSEFGPQKAILYNSIARSLY